MPSMKPKQQPSHGWNQRTLAERSVVATGRSTMHITSTLEKAHRFGTKITSGWPKQLGEPYYAILHEMKHYPALVITTCLQIKTWPCTIIGGASGYSIYVR